VNVTGEVRKVAPVASAGSAMRKVRTTESPEAAEDGVETLAL